MTPPRPMKRSNNNNESRPIKMEKHQYALNEKQVKDQKAHRCSLNMDYKFIEES